MAEWIICEKRTGMDPRTAKPIRMAVVDDDQESLDRFNKLLIEKDEVAYKRSSYGRCFERRCKLNQLPGERITVKSKRGDQQ